MIPFTTIEKKAFNLFQNTLESKDTEIEDFGIHYEEGDTVVFYSRQSNYFVVSDEQGLGFCSRLNN